jgi:hypothetical protein
MGNLAIVLLFELFVPSASVSAAGKWMTNNMRAQKVLTLKDGYFSAGEHSVIWNVLDDRNANFKKVTWITVKYLAFSV